MQLISETSNPLLKNWRLFALAALVPMLAVIAGACAARAEKSGAVESDDGLAFEHNLHIEMDLACDICHSLDEEGVNFSLPGHETCSVCHDIPEDVITAATEAQETGADAGCGLCHTRDDYSMEIGLEVLDEDIVFAHQPHVDKEVACTTCHGEDPDVRDLTDRALKPFCMDCHGDVRPALNECSVCHRETNRETRPTHRADARIPHDMPEIWERTHGREASIDPNFCSLCHEAPADCEECHQKTPPDDHTLSWRQRTHALKAQWDRTRCSVCHEEDSCAKCHESTEPNSHRGTWGSPVNRHCASCHYPPDRTGCTTCHKEIAHKSAAPSPHTYGLFPPNCAVCHPGGLPHRAPHMTNSTTRCVYCHN
jgi:hypothetical protein